MHLRSDPHPGLDRAAAQPRYAAVKQMIRDKIRSGAWPPRHRIPSESQLVSELGVSRMTINRALRELSIEGVLVRMQGLGSFVAEGQQPSDIFELRNIADEILARGNVHSAEVVLLDPLKASPEIAEALNVPIGARVFHSIILHRENDVPIQLEDRYVNAGIAPAYLDQDFSKVTPNHYLTAVAPWTDAEHRVEAVLPSPWESRLLQLTGADPCLLIRRRTWTGPDVASATRLLFPGTRYRIESRRSAHPVASRDVASRAVAPPDDSAERD